jgi:hypothetical protein
MPSEVSRMIAHICNRLTAAVTVLATLIVAVLPGGAWAECGCVAGGCTAEGATSSCCSQTQPSAQENCCAPELHAAQVKCCCTDLGARICSTSDRQHRGSGCKCLPSSPSQAPAQNPATSFESKAGSASDAPLWLAAPLCFDLNVASLLATDVILHAPPIPLRELYCVWRI